MRSRKITYGIQITVILAIFFFVLFNLIFKLVAELQSGDIKEKAETQERVSKKQAPVPKIHLDKDPVPPQRIDHPAEDSTEVFIRTPRYGQHFYTSELPFELEGLALSVAGDFSHNIVWTSNRDGTLGRGAKIMVRPSAGEHIITATGTNGKTTGTMEISVIIEKDPAFLKKYLKK